MVRECAIKSKICQANPQRCNEKCWMKVLHCGRLRDQSAMLTFVLAAISLSLFLTIADHILRSKPSLEGCHCVMHHAHNFFRVL